MPTLYDHDFKSCMCTLTMTKYKHTASLIGLLKRMLCWLKNFYAMYRDTSDNYNDDDRLL